MRRRHFHPHQPAAKINVTPLIDVVMVLIIFYLIVGKMAADRRAHVTLPSSSQGVTLEAKDPVIVTVTLDEMPAGPPKSRLLIDGVEVNEAGLTNALKARVGTEAAKTTILVRADRRLPYSAVAPVVKSCREAGLATLQLATDRTGGSR